MPGIPPPDSIAFSSCEMCIRDSPCPMLINQLDCVGVKRIVLNALILPCIVKLIKIAFDFPALPARPLDGIGKNAVAGLLFVKTPCTVSYTHLDVYKRQN